MEIIEIGLILGVAIANLSTCVFFYSLTERKIEAIQKEMRDFHGRLSSLSERYKK